VDTRDKRGYDGFRVEALSLHNTRCDPGIIRNNRVAIQLAAIVTMKAINALTIAGQSKSNSQY
jgi:hypothetical protein